MGGLEGEALQEAFGFAPGSGGKAARTRCKTETSRGPAAPHPLLASLPAVSYIGGAGQFWAAERPKTALHHWQEGRQQMRIIVRTALQCQRNRLENTGMTHEHRRVFKRKM